MDANHDSSLPFPVMRSPELEKEMKKFTKVYTFGPKKKFLDLGEVLDGVYYIHKGRTKHYILGEDGSEKILYCLSSGWFFGETPCFTNNPTGLISETMETSEIWIIPQSSFMRLFDDHKQFRDAIAECMARKTLIIRTEIENLTFNSVKVRILSFLCTCADTSRKIDNEWYCLKLNPTQYEISTFVGSARVTTSRLMNELCEEGKIRLLNRKIQVSRSAVEEFSLPD
jgi:CRP/FNR family cyclic AMP-dependent transcriptional regulator